MSERSERFRAAAKRRRDAGFIDGSTDGEGLCDDIEALEAKIAAVRLAIRDESFEVGEIRTEKVVTVVDLKFALDGKP